MPHGHPDTWRRIRCAAILAGHRGPQELAEAMSVRGVSYRTMYRVVEQGERGRVTIAEIADLIERHAASRGVTVPAAWIVGGFDGDPAPPTPLASPRALADRARDAINALEREALRGD